MSLKIIACEVMKEELLAVARNPAIEFEFISMGLHLHPEKLGKELQRILDYSKGYERVILAFGLCGGAARNLKASGFILTIPKVHDCIPILLGSKKRFEQLRKEEKGTLYLSYGWMSGEKSILADYARIREKYGEKKAASIYARMYESYRKVLFIHTGIVAEEESLQWSKQIADTLHLQHQETDGDLTYIDKLANGPWDEESFINIPSGGIVDEVYFTDYKSINFYQ